MPFLAGNLLQRALGRGGQVYIRSEILTYTPNEAIIEALGMLVGEPFREIGVRLFQRLRDGVVSAIHMGDVELLQDWIGKGMNMVMYASDLDFLMSSSKVGLDALRS